MRSMKMIFVLVFGFFAMAENASGQQKPDWSKWETLIGEWKGEGSGEPGKGSGVFSFKADLDNHIITRQSHSEYPAAGGRPATIHDDLMMIYLDYANTPTKAIYFDNEGHTINYTITYSDHSIILISDKMANVPIFRLTYTMMDQNKVNTKFEMSQDGKNFTTYIEGMSVRVK